MENQDYFNPMAISRDKQLHQINGIKRDYGQFFLRTEGPTENLGKIQFPHLFDDQRVHINTERIIADAHRYPK